MSPTKVQGRVKIGYATEREARDAAKKIRRKPGMSGHLRPYDCPHCRQWHLTSERRR